MTEQHDTVVDESSQPTPGDPSATEPATGAESATESNTESATGDADTGDADTEADTDADADTDTEPGTPDSPEMTSADARGDGAHGEAVGGEAAGASTRRRPAKTADLEREGEVAADFLETLLDIADLDGDIEVDVDGDRAAVSIVDSEEGRVPRRLVGTDGKVLDALQELTRLAVQSATGERSRLMLDVAGHRAERRAALVTIAQRVIAEVKDTGEKVSMDPMTAFERKVVHDEVLAAGLVSESDGVEPRRFVVVLPG